MLSSKNKGIFVEFNPFSTLVAVTSGLTAPLTVETLKDLPAGMEPEKLKGIITEILDLKGRNLAHGHIGVYPTNRFIRRSSLDANAKFKEPNFFVDLLNTQFRIDAEKNSIAIILATDGSAFDATKPLSNQKEIVIAGSLTEDFRTLQQDIISCNLYPVSLQLGTLSLTAGLMSYCKWMQFRLPTLMLEIGPESSNLIVFGDNQMDVARPIPYGLNAMFPLIQQELGLKDEESAKKLFYSNTFDFTEMGPSLLRKMLKELQSSTGYYEVQTGQTIGQIFISLLPKNLGWIQQVLSKSLGVKVLTVDYASWLKTQQIAAHPSVNLELLDNRWFGLFSLMISHNKNADGNT